MSGIREDNLNESWVEVGDRRAPGGSPVPAKPPNAAMEKLLLEAQKESSSGPSHTDSPASSKASTKSSNGEHAALGTDTPPGDVELMRELKGKDWVWDWSSRPEAIAPSATEPHGSARHGGAWPRCCTSIRNTRFLSGLVQSMESLPLLLLTHACSFLLGATTMFVYLRRYGSWSTTSVASSAA